MKALIACFVILTSLSGSIEIAADSHVNMSGDDFNFSEQMPILTPAHGALPRRTDREEIEIREARI